MMKMKALAAIAAVLSLTAAAASAAPLSESLDTLRAGYRLKIVNDSSLSIREIYLSLTHEYWGPDRLTWQTLDPGHHFSIDALRVGPYDLRLVDEDGDTCGIHGIWINRDRTVTIETEALLRCEDYLPMT
jgi:hypothetical protein